MRKLVLFTVTLGVLGMGCAMAKAPLSGVWFTDVKAPEGVTSVAGTKTGEACATSILGLIATGDASIFAAKQAGGITEVASVDSHATSILGLYAKYCTVIRGK